MEQEDSISMLPKDIIGHILSFLSLVEAVRTSVLSRGWRYKWTDLPYLVFAGSCVRSSSSRLLKFEELVSRFPLLESLILKLQPLHLSQVTICAPNLLFFQFNGNDDVTLVHKKGDEACGDSLKFFVQLPMVRKLNIDSFYMKYLAFDVVPGVQPMAFMALAYLKLKISCCSEEDYDNAFCILSACPNLEKLKIVAQHFYHDWFHEREGAISDDNCSGQLLTKLKYVELNCVLGSSSEMNLVKFILSNSPALERMNISFRNPDRYHLDEVQTMAEMYPLLKQLLTLRRASGCAQVIFEE